MSCLLNTYGIITNLNNIINFLIPTDSKNDLLDDNLNEKNDVKWSNDDWNDWNENKEDTSQEKSTNKSITTNKQWLDMFHISVSPCGNIICIAYKRNIIVLHGKWENNQIKYNISSRISLETSDEQEEITSIICIPIASQKKSGEGLLEWTSIIIGFNKGNVRMYTENGTLLVTQMFHDQAVVKIKCRTSESAKYIGWIDQYDEVQILYNNNVLVVIDGCSLYNYLKTARIYAAKSTSQLTEVLSTLTLEYKKWSIEQNILTDFVSAGYRTDNRFNQLFNASMAGPNERFQYNPPRFNWYLTCGYEPFFGMYSASEESAVLNGFALSKVVAGKVTNVLMNAAKGWMGFGKSSNVKQKPKIEPATLIDGRSALSDLRRLGESIIISPGNTLAATTDSFARITLIDVNKGIATRMFKGYRDAQIGWIHVDDESDDKLVKKSALYLIIYAARRGLIEVWGCQQGVRVAAFNIGKKCKLFYPGFYMLSLNGSLLSEKERLNNQFQCFIIDEEGAIKTINIPFHLILSDKSNQRVRDGVLFKKLKLILKNSSKESDSLWNDILIILKDCKTSSIKEQMIDKLLNTSYLSPLKIKSTLTDLIVFIEKQGENTSSDQNKLKSFCKYQFKLIDSYVSILEFYKASNNFHESNSLDENEKEVLLQLLDIETNKFDEFINIQNKIKSKQNNSEKNENLEDFSLQNYIASFEESYNSNNELKISLKADLNLKDKSKLGSFLFSCWFYCNRNEATSFETLLEILPLQKTQLLDLFVLGFLNQKEIYYKNIINLYELSVSLIIKNSSDSDKEEEFIEKLILSCNSALNLNCSIILVWIFRSISKKNDLMEKITDSLNTLANRLLDMIHLFYLCQIGASKLQNYLNFDFNIKNVLQRGKGIFSEIVGKHVIQNRLPPILLTSIDAEEEGQMEVLKNNQVFKEFYDELQFTRKLLPKSLESDSLLANAGWEAISLFNKNGEDVKSFEDSLKYCAQIENAVLKQGVTTLIWHSSINKKIAALTNLIEKIEKAPKDRLLRKDTGIPEHEIIKFLENSLILLDLIMDSNCSVNEVPIFNYDNFWLDNSELYSVLPQTTTAATEFFNNESISFYNNNSSSKQFVELAAEQKYVNYHLCLFHYQIVRILFFIMKYSMKLIRPLALFDTKGKHTLFSELHTHPLISNDVDITIVNARKFFFMKIINSIVEQINVTENEKEKLDKEIQDLFTIVLNLSKDMGIDNEFIKGHYACILFSINYYDEAQKIMHTIKDKQLIALKLLNVIGHKINLILNDNYNANTLSMLSTNLSSWLKSIGSSDIRISKPISKESLNKLISIVNSELDDNCGEYKIASELLEFTSNTELKIIKNN